MSHPTLHTYFKRGKEGGGRGGEEDADLKKSGVGEAGEEEEEEEKIPDPPITRLHYSRS